MGDDMAILLELLLLAGLAAVFYGLLIRPQQQRLRRHRQMLASLRPGDRIATIGGVVGTIARIEETDFLAVEISRGVEIFVTRKSIDAVISEGQADVSPQHGLADREHVAPSMTI